MFVIGCNRAVATVATPRFGGEFDVGNIIWTILTILFVFWLIGLVAHIGGSLINLILVIVVIGVIYNLLTGRRSV
jgi:hypothetical protein